MPFVAPTLGVMETGITLEILAEKSDALAGNIETLATKLDDLTSVMRAGFAYMERKFAEIDSRLEQYDHAFEAIAEQFSNIDDRFMTIDRRFANIEKMLEKLNIIENAVYNMQVDINTIQSEMRGIHKVLDNLNGRLTIVERYLGLQAPLFEI